MASLVRLRVGDPPDSPNAFSLLLSTLEPDPSSHGARSRVDRAFVDWTLGTASDSRASNLDPDYLKVFLLEVSRHGPPRPIETRGPARCASDRLDVAWDDFHLRRGREGFELAFVEAISGKGCRFQLRATAPPRAVDRPTAGASQEEVGHLVYARLRLDGTVDGEPVEGEAWLDHEWGEVNGLAGRASDGRMLGYDWFSIHLDDGSDWTLISFRDAQSDTPLGKRATVWIGDETRVGPTFSLETLTGWESEATRIRYPVARRITVPELDAELTFTPLVDEQEIRLLGPSRALWQGAGTVTGRMAERVISGYARAGFSGYGYVFDFQQCLEPLQRRVDRRIEEFFPKSIDEDRLQEYVGRPTRTHEPRAYGKTLSEPVWDLLLRKGKRWRPIFGLLVLEALGTASEPYEALLCNLAELTHTGALIIDDIEDSSGIRRGDTTIHLKYGTDVAINAANTLYFLPSLLIKSHERLSDPQRIQLYEIVIGQFVRAHFGQALDIYWSREMGPANLEGWMKNSLGPKILQMYEYKTAAAVAGFAEAAAVIAEAKHAVRAACARLARAFGVSFQIVDDTHNFSASPKWDKKAGEDLSEGKLTYAIYCALNLLEGTERRRLRDILCSRELRSDEGALREGVELVRRSGALDRCRREAKTLLEAAWTCFAAAIPSSEPKMMLQMLCLKLLDLADDV
jgi:geranylgeranyl diphosphate synthase type I